MRNLFDTLKNFILPLRYYVTIDELPIQNWFKLHKENDFKYLIKNRYDLKIIYLLAIIPLWFISVYLAAGWTILGLFIRDKYFIEGVFDKVFDQFITEIGLSPEYVEYLELQKKIVSLQCDYIKTPSPVNKSILRAAQAEYLEKSKQKTVEYTELIATLSKMQGYPVWDVTVRQFYSYLKANAGK